MEDKTDKKAIKLEGGIEISQEAFEKVRKKVINDYTKDMARNLVKKEFQCYGCKNLPRPGQTTIKQCKPCSKIFCGICGSHKCSDGYQRNPEISLPLKINLDFLPYFCKNNKFGCEEILFKEAELLKHEYVCEFQLTYCADSLCNSEVNVLNYLDHYKEKHGNHDDLGEGKTFEFPLPMDQIQSKTMQVILRNSLLAVSSSTGSYHGKYQLSDTVNGKPSWIKNSNAIWYNNKEQVDTWHMGPKNVIGQNLKSNLFFCIANWQRIQT